MVSSVPAAIFAGLSPDVRKAAQEVLADRGFKLEFLTAPKGGKVERQYVQDVFRHWLEAANRSR